MLTRLYHIGLAWLLATLVLSLALGVGAWIVLHERYAAGWVVWSQPGPEGHQRLAQVEAPWRASRMLVFASGNHTEALTGHWVLASGTPRVLGQWHVLVVEQMRTLPFLRVGTLRAGQPARGMDALTAHRGVAVGLGVAIVLLGAIVVRGAARLAGALFGAVLAWHVVVLAAFETLLSLPEASVPASLLLGGVLGLVLGCRCGGPLGPLAQRLLVLLLVDAFASRIAESLGWPVEVTRLVGCVGTLLTPMIGLWLLGTYFLVVGLAAHGPASRLVLGAAGLAVRASRRELGLPRWGRLLTRGVRGAAA